MLSPVQTETAERDVVTGLCEMELNGALPAVTEAADKADVNWKLPSTRHCHLATSYLWGDKGGVNTAQQQRSSLTVQPFA